jgi:hypothetical protein
LRDRESYMYVELIFYKGRFVQQWVCPKIIAPLWLQKWCHCPCLHWEAGLLCEAPHVTNGSYYFFPELSAMEKAHSLTFFISTSMIREARHHIRFKYELAASDLINFFLIRTCLKSIFLSSFPIPCTPRSIQISGILTTFWAVFVPIMTNHYGVLMMVACNMSDVTHPPVHWWSLLHGKVHADLAAFERKRSSSSLVLNLLPI